MVALARSSHARFLPLSLFWGIAVGSLLVLNMETLPGTWPLLIYGIGGALGSTVAAHLIATYLIGPSFFRCGQPRGTWAIGWAAVGITAAVAAVMVGIVMFYVMSYTSSAQQGTGDTYLANLPRDLGFIVVLLVLTVPIALIEGALSAGITLPLAFLARAWLCRGTSENDGGDHGSG